MKYFPVTPPPETRFLNCLNLLRGICAITVLVFHYQNFFMIGTEEAADFSIKQQPYSFALTFIYLNGGIAVQVFWCISGIVMAHNYLSKLRTTHIEFFVARFARLYPLHFVTLIVVGFLQYVSLSNFHQFQIFPHNSLSMFVRNVLFIQGWTDRGKGFSFNAPTWSVSIEIFVYILFFYLSNR